jgi:hypothetical protein
VSQRDERHLAGDDLDTKALAAVIAAFEAVVTGELRDGRH